MRGSQQPPFQTAARTFAMEGPQLSIAVVCIQKSGHMLCLLRICAELCKRGHKVRVYTAEYGKDEFEKKVKQTGAEFVALDMQGKTEESITQEADKKGVFENLELSAVMLPALRQECAKSKPDVVLADFASAAGPVLAEEMDLPLLINLPGPLSVLQAFIGMADASTGFNFLGLHLERQRLSMPAFARWTNVFSFGTWGAQLHHHVGRGAIVLVQTIWGLDQTLPIYPNVVVTGPVLPPAANLREKLAREHVELHQFLRASDGSGSSVGVVYVTTGSMAKLHDWQVRVLFSGLKKTQCRVVWSLKEELHQFLPVKDDPDFFIRKWTPQAELLQDPAIKVVITHCGWGGTLETLTAGKPIVAIPFFAEQPVNACLLKDRGVAELIGRIPKGIGREHNPYKEGWMTEETVYSAVSKVMRSPSYTEEARKLMKASQASGGVAAAAQQVEWAGWHGIHHLKPTNFQGSTGSSPFSGCLAGLAAVCACSVMHLKFGCLM
ncbi:UGT2B23 [Symbiodinium natans]|uniref:UGT2B23 protein n=1 Tax=Symbiodinium natans TaxID=878477 RepID=A0A812J9I2_9DINO|nr:UGT2B23 [Symbiodinium natans]